MPRRIANQALNASTIDIMNVIRKNASPEYYNSVPAVTQAKDIPKVGEIIYGNPAFSNYFVNALVNRIAIVRVQSATFNNPYARLKKGYLEFGETIEDIFVNIAKAFDYSAEKAEAREMKRYIPDVRAAFYVMNWRVMYPVTIQDEDLKQAFLSMEGVQDLIAKIVDQVYTGAEYDEFLLFKYLMIKAISHGKTYPVSIGAATDFTDAAVQFRGISNVLNFMKEEYNEEGVLNNTPRSRQVIFMDAIYNAQFDVNVLASAFNMDKATFMGSLYLIDDWTTFDSKRFDVIMANSDMLEPVTAAELTAMGNVKAFICDERWFQVYDNNNKFTEKYVASGLYWNYFYHVWKTIAHSPFANAVSFVTSAASLTPPATLTMTIKSISQNAEATVINVGINDITGVAASSYQFIQTEDATELGVAVQTYGSYMIPATLAAATVIPVSVWYAGKVYSSATGKGITVADAIGATLTLSPPSA